MSLYLPVLWAFIVGLGVFLYVMLDGFDLGLGLLFPFFDARSERQVILNTVAPVWDGTKPSWCWAARCCTVPSRWPMPRCCRPTTCRWC